jgi:hypothetical protein
MRQSPAVPPLVFDVEDLNQRDDEKNYKKERKTGEDRKETLSKREYTLHLQIHPHTVCIRDSDKLSKVNRSQDFLLSF